MPDGEIFGFVASVRLREPIDVTHDLAQDGVHERCRTPTLHSPLRLLDRHVYNDVVGSIKDYEFVGSNSENVSYEGVDTIRPRPRVNQEIKPTSPAGYSSRVLGDTFPVDGAGRPFEIEIPDKTTALNRREAVQ
jgi:hypothetical protein